MQRGQLRNSGAAAAVKVGERGGRWHPLEEALQALIRDTSEPEELRN